MFGCLRFFHFIALTRFFMLHSQHYVFCFCFIAIIVLCFFSFVVYALYRVRTGPGKPGKSWNFIMAFSRTGKSWKKATGPGKLWKFVKLS